MAPFAWMYGQWVPFASPSVQGGHRTVLENQSVKLLC